jgi:predicted RNA-binding protein with RPS1 domain
MINIGDVVKGEITAIKPYGAFVKLKEDYVGLIHISEFSDGFVRSIEDYVGEGDVVDLKVIKINNRKISLSYKALHKRKKRYTIELDSGFTPLREALDEWITQYNVKDGE